MEKEGAKDELFAFWKYDLFPFVKGGVVGRLEDGGLAYIPSYQGSVRPIKLVRRDLGEEVHARLRQLEGLRRKELADSEKKFRKLRDEIFDSI